MAIVDSLLKLVAMRGADALILQTGQVPSLSKDGRLAPLSMPTPGMDVIAAMLREITDATQRLQLSSEGRLRTNYRAVDGSLFSAEISAGGGNDYKLVFHLSEDSSAEPAPQAAPKVAPRGPSSVRRAPPESRSPAAQQSGSMAALPAGSAGSAATGPASAGAARLSALPSASQLSMRTDLDVVLEQAETNGASDVLLSEGAAPRFRIGGSLRVLESGSSVDIRSFVDSAVAASDRQLLASSGSCDLAYTSGRGLRYRVNLFKQERGLGAAFRPIRNTPPTLAQLNLPGDFQQLTQYRSGMVLMVGTAGSGKSTTLAALIEQLNRSADKHIITLEDPIEYLYAPDRCLIHQRELGRHLASFSVGLRAALRESPDVILLGEMRDYETIAAALTAAETGHLVLSTLHSGSAVMAIDRMIDVFPEHQQQQVRYQLSEVLRAVVTQHLLVSARPPGRVPVFEKLVVNRAVSTKIRDNRTHQIETELQKGRSEGMVPLEVSLSRLVKSGQLARQAALEFANDASYLEQLIHDASRSPQI